jgi:wyosine [tRNA(Phe)-imidazoG37] synthetase (radical SAM superfamily)
MTHIFGPVPSRRLGRSLGIDLIPFKACTFDCLYCQLGRTENTTIESQGSVAVDDVIDELKTKLSSRPDYITLSGSGEPTLYSHIGELIEKIKALTTIPVAIITNGSLLWKADIRKALKTADLVVPSLDAGDEVVYNKVNRPHHGISFHKLVDGLIAFREEFANQYWLEVLLLSGISDSEDKVNKIASIARRIKPDRVQLNTCVRPPADSSAHMVSKSRLEELARLFTPFAEVIADYRHDADETTAHTGTQEILAMLSRRPCSAADIASGLGVPLNEVIKNLDQLLSFKKIEATRTESGLVHYVIKSHI